MPSVKDRMNTLLKDTVDYYSADVKRRAVVKLNNGVGTACVYLDRNTGNKCAIGRNLTEYEMTTWADKVGSFTTLTDEYEDGLEVPLAFHGLPTWFAFDLQNIHDSYKNWTKNGLSGIGDLKVRDLQTKIDHYQE